MTHGQDQNQVTSGPAECFAPRAFESHFRQVPPLCFPFSSSPAHFYHDVGRLLVLMLSSRVKIHLI